MTPKEKAIYILSDINNQPITLSEWVNASLYAKSDLKRKALIVVIEVINQLNDDGLYIQGETNIDEIIKYWQEVKQEIEKL